MVDRSKKAMGRTAPTVGIARTMREVGVAEVLLDGLRWADPGPTATKLQRRAHGRRKVLAHNLLGFFAEARVSDLTPVKAQEYANWRKHGSVGLGSRKRYKEGRTEHRAPPSDRTSNGELQFLRTVTRAFATRHDLTWPGVNLGDLRHGKGKKRKPLSRDDVARLLWAARGCRFDPDAAPVDAPRALKATCFRPPTDERRPGQRRRWRRHLVRFLLIAYYTGSGVDCVTTLRWEGDPDGDASYVDVDAGLLWRLGADAAPGKQAGMPVPIPPRLLRHLRHWREADRGEGHERVIHSVQRPELAQPPKDVFQNVRIDASLPDAQMYMLADATGAELMRKGVSIGSASLFMGLTPTTLLQRYGHKRSDFHEKARTALENRAATVRSMPQMTLDWRAIQVRRRS